MSEKGYLLLLNKRRTRIWRPRPHTSLTVQFIALVWLAKVDEQIYIALVGSGGVKPLRVVFRQYGGCDLRAAIKTHTHTTHKHMKKYTAKHALM